MTRDRLHNESHAFSRCSLKKRGRCPLRKLILRGAHSPIGHRLRPELRRERRVTNPCANQSAVFAPSPLLSQRQTSVVPATVEIARGTCAHHRDELCHRRCDRCGRVLTNRSVRHVTSRVRFSREKMDVRVSHATSRSGQFVDVFYTPHNRRQ